MAINFGSGDAPYVHSNINNFQYNSPDIGDVITRDVDLTSSIATLETIRNRLKNEADQFLMGMGTEKADADLLMADNTYSGIATRIIQNPSVIRSLVVSSVGDVSLTDLKKMLNNGNAGERIKNNILNLLNDRNNISVEELSQIIGKSMGNANGKITKAGTKLDKFFSFDNSLQEQLEQNYGKQIFNRLSSSNGKIVNIIKDTLVSSGKVKSNNVTNSVDRFMETFSELFVREAKSAVSFYDKDFTPQKYLEKLRSILKQTIVKNITEVRNAAGITNEDILAAIYQADDGAIVEIRATGTKTEDDIVNQFSSLNKMITHHTEHKSSQTDVVIINKLGMSARAQSKTSFREYTIKNDEATRILNHLQRAVNIYKLLVSLNETGAFSISNIDEICYCLANALWFSTHISISGKRVEGDLTTEHAKIGTDLLNSVVESLNILLTRQIPSFFGISLQRTVDEIKVDAAGSNLFYIENGHLVPTWIELEEVIQDLRNYENNTIDRGKSMRFYVDRKSPAWPYKNALTFWKTKLPEPNAYNPVPGFVQGAAAISALTVHGNFSALLQYSSYNIGK